MSAKYSINQTTKALVFTGQPESLKKNSVKKKDKENFTSVVIPNSVSSIDAWAFPKCRALTSIHIPNSISTVSNYSFEYFSSLAFVHIPNSVSSIGFLSFRECPALASVHIPNSVSTIGFEAFDNCPKLHIAFLPTNSKTHPCFSSFSPQTSIFRPRIKPIFSLQKKSACRAAKASSSIYL